MKRSRLVDEAWQKAIADQDHQWALAGVQLVRHPGVNFLMVHLLKSTRKPKIVVSVHSVFCSSIPLMTMIHPKNIGQSIIIIQGRWANGALQLLSEVTSWIYDHRPSFDQQVMELLVADGYLSKVIGDKEPGSCRCKCFT